MRYLLDLLYLVALVLYAPLLAWRMAVQGKWRRGWSERLGRPPARRGNVPLIWIHAVSVGEANATRTLVDQLRRELPDHELAFSTTTDTGYARLAQLYPDAVRFHFPFDFSIVIARVFRRLRPAMIVLMELEVWPNLLARARRSDVPVVVVNGRLSERSFRRYRRVRWLVRPMFRRLAAVCAQDVTYASRFEKLGTPAERVFVTGSVKYDTAAVADRVAGQEALAAALGIDASHQWITAGSTGPGEEAILLRVYQQLRAAHPAARLAIVPRKPERFNEVAELIVRAGLTVRRRSEWADGADSPPADGDTVALGDTMGELRKFYALSTVVFVGRTLVPMGGSDVMEAAALARPVLVGPHVENFAEPAGRLRDAGGLKVVADEGELQAAADVLLRDEATRGRMAVAARQAVLAAQGATQRTVEVIGNLLGQPKQAG